jgi:putative ABC transport system permease protein
MFFDLKYSLRQLRKSKGLTLAVIVSLALCIGANALIFSMLYGLVLKRVPFSYSDRLFEIYNSYPKLGVSNYHGNVAQYLEYSQHPELFSGAGLFHQTSATLGGPDGPYRVDVGRVTPSLFATLAVSPVAGRFFDPASTTPNSDRPIVLAYSFWQAQFGSNPAVVGRTLTVGQQPCTIVGVAPASLQYFGPTVAFFTPQTWTERQLDELSRHTKDVSFIGRLVVRFRPGISRSQAAAQVDAFDRRRYDTGSADYRRYVEQSGFRSVVHSLWEEQAAAQRGTLCLLQGAALLVLLIGCVNVANLLLGRAAYRQSELSIRHALGGGRWQIARQLLTESLLLSLLGGACGVALAAAGLGAVNRFAPGLLGNETHFHVDSALLLFTAVLSLAVGLLSGTWPAWRAARSNIVVGLGQNSRGSSSGPRARFFGSLLVSGQTALSLVLLVGAGLLVRSLILVLAVSPGFDPRGVTTVRVALQRTWFPDLTSGLKWFVASPQAELLQERIARALQRIPDVESVGFATHRPLADDFFLADLFIFGVDSQTGGAHPLVNYLSVSSDYFAALGIRLRDGRSFDQRDEADGARSAIVDQRFANFYYPHEIPIGKKIALYDSPKTDKDWWTIVGVADTVHYNALDEMSERGFVYLPIQKAQDMGINFFVRSRRPAGEVIPLIRREIQTVSPSLPIFATGSMDDFVAASLNDREGVLILLVAFAVIALVLAVVGIYSVLAYDVARRTREIGIRGAIGASQSSILRLILGQGMRTVGIGLAAGLVGAIWLGRLMTNMLFHVSPSDPPTLILISGAMFATGLLASLLPARRASRIDPIVALHCE